MDKNNDISLEIIERVKDACANHTSLSIRAGNSKAFYGQNFTGEPIDIAAHRGITEYDPRELVLTARAGTRLAEIERALAENKQMLAFEPPCFNDLSTLGGAIACGLSGPRRPYAGSARDFVLGIRCINGRGEHLSFGGQVMKNVAGYDVSRLMTGAMGTLGILTEVSIKVLPKPAVERTLQKECSISDYLETNSTLAQLPTPLSASCYDGQKMYLRLSGSERSVEAACNKLAGDGIHEIQEGNFWQQIGNQQHPFFDTQLPVWRLSLPADTLPLQFDGETLIDWGGAQRWVKTSEPAELIRALCSAHGGHATLFKGGDRSSDIFHPLDEGIACLHKSLKTAFDPAGIFNPGRMYKTF